MRAHGLQRLAMRPRRVWAHGLQGGADDGSWKGGRIPGCRVDSQSCPRWGGGCNKCRRTRLIGLRMAPIDTDEVATEVDWKLAQADVGWIGLPAEGYK